MIVEAFGTICRTERSIDETVCTTEEEDRSDTRIRHWEIDRHVSPKLTTEASNTGEKAAENDATYP